MLRTLTHERLFVGWTLMARALNGIPMGPGMAALAEAIDRFCERAQDARSPEDLAGELIHLRYLCDRLELEFSKSAAAFAATNEYDAQGSTSPVHWIRLNCHMASGAAGDRVAVGEKFASIPMSVATMTEGEIGFAHLALIARTAEALAESPTAKPFDETRLLDKARDFSVGRSAGSATTCATPPTRKAMQPRRHVVSKRGR